jgi:hypothetical protein
MELTRCLKCNNQFSDARYSLILKEDLQAIFSEEQKDKLPSTLIIERLSEIKDGPWREWKDDKPINFKQLARLLKPFGVTSSPFWRGNQVIKGYSKTDLVNISRWDENRNLRIEWFCKKCRSQKCSRCGIILGNWVCPICAGLHGTENKRNKKICLGCSKRNGEISITAAKRFLEFFKQSDAPVPTKAYKYNNLKIEDLRLRLGISIEE